ncbi:MAG: hypothetical protein HZA03_08860 [Nitrospinae bacterium]|nr:hypothetical protein [Nitrospinota bacterium]
MALGLGSARLNVTAKGAPPPPVQQVKPARTSIAEDAVFIPKPHKRVDFKVNVPGGGTGEVNVGFGGGKSAGKPIPLPGQATDNGGGVMQPIGAQDVTGQNISYGSLGQHGLTAEFGKASYAAPEQLVKTEYAATPKKDFTAIASQEEGRQTNNAKQTHYTQQYDAYGRPRIGFSREPYDFAATKYMSKTSQIKFQQNMQATRQAYGKYAASGAAPETGAVPQSGDLNVTAQPDAAMADSAQAPAQPEVMTPESVKIAKGLIDPKETPKNFIGADKALKEGMVSYDPKEANILGGAKMQKGMIDPAKAAAPEKTDIPDPKETLLKGESALVVAEKMGMTANAVMKPAADTGLGGKAVGEVAAMMGMNLSAVLTARPEKVADFHAAAPLLKSNAAISVSA